MHVWVLGRASRCRGNFGGTILAMNKKHKAQVRVTNNVVAGNKNG